MDTELNPRWCPQIGEFTVIPKNFIRIRVPTQAMYHQESRLTTNNTMDWASSKWFLGHASFAQRKSQILPSAMYLFVPYQLHGWRIEPGRIPFDECGFTCCCVMFICSFLFTTFQRRWRLSIVWWTLFCIAPYTHRYLSYFWYL